MSEKVKIKRVGGSSKKTSPKVRKVNNKDVKSEESLDEKEAFGDRSKKSKKKELLLKDVRSSVDDLEVVQEKEFDDQQAHVGDISIEAELSDGEENGSDRLDAMDSIEKNHFESDSFSEDSNRDHSNEVTGELNITLSRSLFKKVKSQAFEEGISISEYLVELISEGVIVRAWEIIERKSQMRNQPHNQVGNRNSGGVSHNRNGGGGHHNQRKGLHNRNGMSHGRYQSIMDDKATFLEYVRNQERNRR